MRVGLDVYTIRHLGLDPLATIAYCRAHDLDGVHFFSPLEVSPTLDAGQLEETRREAEHQGLYLEVGLPTVNPHRFAAGRGSDQVAALGNGDYARGLERCVRAARALGCREVRSHVGARGDRLDPDDPWPGQLRDTAAFLRGLRPLLRDLGCRVNLETHADCTTTELVRLVEALGEEVQGICLDIGNTFRQLEDPVAATRRAAPYVHLTHTKDAIVFFAERGLAWQARPCGRGAIDWSVVLPILGAHAPDLTLSIEDEPYVRDLPIFDPGFLAYHPDLTAAELAELVRVARVWQARIDRGETAEPHAYEAAIWQATADERIDSARAHLQEVLRRTGLG
jgi:sugar phosphate isomerase/epimerase